MENDRKITEKHLCRSCAPVLFGVKPAAFICTSPKEREMLERIKYICPIKFMAADAGARGQIFLYIPELIEGALRRPGSLYMLRSIGYGGDDVDTYVRQLVGRIRGSMSRRNLFPHEIGIFLGYPLEDVIGFWMQGGHGARMEGEWKVYSDVAAACELQHWHQKARDVMEYAIDAGMPMEEILMEYWGSCSRKYLCSAVDFSEGIV